jgi:hypothetical protein
MLVFDARRIRFAAALPGHLAVAIQQYQMGPVAFCERSQLLPVG